MELYLVFDNIQKPSNVGTIIRLALAIEAKLIFTGNSIHHTHPKCKGAAVGYIDRAEVAYYPNLETCIEELSQAGISIYGTSPQAKTPHWDIDFTTKSAVVFGNEISGLSSQKLTLTQANLLIPIPGSVESLNLASSAAVIGYEALRQNKILEIKNLPKFQGTPDKTPRAHH
ncbi:RNA methyltransferase [Puniceicoccaceae bacterium K14]|nr:RNA methyltransferase [Puniceicoccaceae bacterium K14]